MKLLPFFAAAASLALLLPATPVGAQENQQPGGGDRRRSFDPEAMRRMMGERLKQAMKATDEEWTVLEPMIFNVFEKQMATRGGFGRGPGGPPRDGSGSGSGGSRGSSNRPSFFGNPPPEAQALRELLEQQDAPKEDIRARLEALRAQRKRAQQELEDARAQLAKVVTIRQEAVLVAAGVLE